MTLALSLFHFCVALPSRSLQQLFGTPLYRREFIFVEPNRIHRGACMLTSFLNNPSFPLPSSLYLGEFVDPPCLEC